MQPTSGFSPQQIASINTPSAGGSAPAQKFDPNATTMQTPLASPDTSIGDTIKSQADSGISDIKESLNGDETRTSAPEKGLQLGSGLATLLTSPLAPIFAPIGKAVDAIGGTIGNWKSLQDFTQAHPEATDIITRISKDTSNLANIVGTEAGTVEGAGKLGDLADKITTPSETAPETPTIDKNGVASDVKGDSTPNLSKGEVATRGYTDENGKVIPRTAESEGVFGKRTVTQTPDEIASDKALTDAKAQGYGGKTNLEKFNSLQQPLVDNRLAFRDSLGKETTTVTPQKMVGDTSAAIEEATGEKLSMAKQQPTVRNFINNLIKGSQQVDPTPLGVHDLIEKMNQVYENAGGKYVGDKALDTVYRASNNALKNLLDERAPNSGVTDYFSKQTALHNASDVLAEKAQAESPTKFGRYLQDHPMAQFGAKLGTRIGVRVIAGDIIRGGADAFKDIGK